MISTQFFSDNTGLYFYSAWLQANASIIAIFGVFVIYKIQAFQSSIDIIKGSLMGDLSRRVTTPDEVVTFDRMNIEDKNNYVKNRDPFLKKPLQDWVEKQQSIETLKSIVRIPTTLLAIGIGIDSLGLLFANYVNKCGEIVELSIFAFALFFHLFAIFEVVRRIFVILK